MAVRREYLSKKGIVMVIGMALFFAAILHIEGKNFSVYEPTESVYILESAQNGFSESLNYISGRLISGLAAGGQGKGKGRGSGGGGSGGGGSSASAPGHAGTAPGQAKKSSDGGAGDSDTGDGGPGDGDPNGEAPGDEPGSEPGEEPPEEPGPDDLPDEWDPNFDGDLDIDLGNIDYDEDLGDVLEEIDYNLFEEPTGFGNTAQKSFGQDFEMPEQFELFEISEVGEFIETQLGMGETEEYLDVEEPESNIEFTEPEMKEQKGTKWVAPLVAHLVNIPSLSDVELTPEEINFYTKHLAGTSLLLMILFFCLTVIYATYIYFIKE